MTSHFISQHPYQSPCGILLLASYDGQLCLCDWETNPHREQTAQRLCRALKAHFIEQTSEVINQACAQLDEYFCGKRTTFSVPLLMPIGTPSNIACGNVSPRCPMAPPSRMPKKPVAWAMQQPCVL